MPPRKQPKETVVYPASKKKTPAYKPLRPSGIPRIPTTESESSARKQSNKAPSPAKKKAAPKRPLPAITLTDSEDDEDGNSLRGAKRKEVADSDAGEVSSLPSLSEEDTMTSKAKIPPKKKVKPPPPPPRRKDSDTSMTSSIPAADSPPAAPATTTTASRPPMPSQSDDTPSIPQPLLLRLLHESFADKNTRIDTHAIQVVQKYIEIFVREAIARTQAEKREAAERGDVDMMDAGWLELEDLEKVAPGLVLDF